jgi:formylglycine-generating enzyme required for sulfatase activity
MRNISFLSRASFALVVVATGLACAKGDKRPRGPTAEETPQAIAVAGGSMESGFATAPSRQSFTVAGFRITKSPITVAQYRACEGVGACPAARPETCSAKPATADNEAANCVGSAGAAAYCSWVGGRVPTAAEWMLAARGPRVLRYAWGSTPPTCDQHPRGSLHRGPKSFGTCENTSTATGLHPKGASPVGLEDVLLTEGELVAANPDAHSSACAPPYRGCVIYGLAPAAIDAVTPVIGHDDVEQVDHTYSFRCAFEGGSDK